MASDIRGWIGAYVFPTFVLQLRKNPGKTSTRKPDPIRVRTRARWVSGNDVTSVVQKDIDLHVFTIICLKTYIHWTFIFGMFFTHITQIHSEEIIRFEHGV